MREVVPVHCCNRFLAAVAAGAQIRCPTCGRWTTATKPARPAGRDDQVAGAERARKVAAER